jgi:ketosteroid isomerase-like protein
MGSPEIELVMQLLHAFNRGDRDAFVALHHDDAEIVPLRAAVEDTVYRPPDAAEAFWDAADELWERMWVDLEAVREVGGRMLGLGTFHATARTSGVPVSEPVAFVFVVRDGKVAYSHIYSDRDQARTAVREEA